MKDKAKPDNSWVEIEPTAAEQQSGVIAKAKHNKYPAAVVVKRTPRKLDPDFKIRDLPKDLAKTFMAKPNVKLTGHGLTKVGTYQAAEVSYETEAGGETQINRTIVIPMQWQTFYISLSAKKAAAGELGKDFPKITLSFLKKGFLQ